MLRKHFHDDDDECLSRVIPSDLLGGKVDVVLGNQRAFFSNSSSRRKDSNKVSAEVGMERGMQLGCERVGFD